MTRTGYRPVPFILSACSPSSLFQPKEKQIITLALAKKMKLNQFIYLRQPPKDPGITSELFGTVAFWGVFTAPIQH